LRSAIIASDQIKKKYILEHFELSINAIEDITKRNTGEYAIRPYIRMYPAEMLQRMTL